VVSIWLNSLRAQEYGEGKTTTNSDKPESFLLRDNMAEG
jgi:hypothetical protein